MSFSCLGSVGMTWVHWIAYYCYDTELRKKYLGKIYWDWLPCQCWVHTGQFNPKPLVTLRESTVKELALGFLFIYGLLFASCPLPPKDWRQLSSPVPPTPEHFSHLSHPARPNFSWEAFPVWSINLDSCGPDLPLTTKAESVTFGELPGVRRCPERAGNPGGTSQGIPFGVQGLSGGWYRVWSLPMKQWVVSSAIPMQREPRPWGASLLMYSFLSSPTQRQRTSTGIISIHYWSFWVS